ncbi:MAG: carbohydrate ABC transporter permease [Deinococcales bacterium]
MLSYQDKGYQQRDSNQARLQKYLGRIFLFLVLVIFSFIILFPFYWVLRTALTSPNMVYSNVKSLLPVEPTINNFLRVLGAIDPQSMIDQGATNISAGKLNFWLFIRNSFIVGLLTTLGQVFFSTTAAYAFARLKFPFRNVIFSLYLAGLMIPGIVLFIPNYVLIKELGWINSFIGIIAPAFLMTPFAVFFMRQFFLNLNTSIEEAAILDGATKIGFFWRVALPLIQGPAITLGILTFITTWNQYLWPFVVGRDESVRMLTVALSVFRAQTPQGAPDWSGLMAGAAVSIVPSILIFIFLGRRVVDSIQFSGFK